MWLMEAGATWERKGGGVVCVREEAREGICKARVAQVLCMD